MLNARFCFLPLFVGESESCVQQRANSDATLSWLSYLCRLGLVSLTQGHHQQSFSLAFDVSLPLQPSETQTEAKESDFILTNRKQLTD